MRRRRMAALAGKKQSGPVLPDGCVLVDYICGTTEDYGHYPQYVQTDTYPDLDCEIEGEFESYMQPEAPWLYYFGVFSGDDTLDQFSLRRWDWDPNSGAGVFGDQSIKIAIPSGRFYFSMNKTKVCIDDVIYTFTQTPTQAVYNGLLYFCSGNRSDRSWRTTKNKVYWAKIRKSGVLIADLVPVKYNESQYTLVNLVTQYVCPSSSITGA